MSSERDYGPRGCICEARKDENGLVYFSFDGIVTTDRLCGTIHSLGSGTYKVKYMHLLTKIEGEDLLEQDRDGASGKLFTIKKGAKGVYINLRGSTYQGGDLLAEALIA